MTQPHLSQLLRPNPSNDNRDVTATLALRTVSFWHHRLAIATLRGELELVALYRRCLDRALERFDRDRVAALLRSVRA